MFYLWSWFNYKVCKFFIIFRHFSHYSIYTYVRWRIFEFISRNTYEYLPNIMYSQGSISVVPVWLDPSLSSSIAFSLDLVLDTSGIMVSEYSSIFAATSEIFIPNAFALDLDEMRRKQCNEKGRRHNNKEKIFRNNHQIYQGENKIFREDKWLSK